MTDTDPPPQAPLLNIDQTLQQAVEHHRAGRQEEAVRLYQSILQTDPRHAEANNNMGVMAVEVEQPAAGLSYFMAALDADPSSERYWLNYIDALFQANELETAREVLALARQQGLQGSEADALAMRLEGVAVAEQRHNAEDPHAAEESRVVPSDFGGKNMPNAIPAKPGESARKSAPQMGGCPGPKEQESLINLFGQGRFTEAATLAQAMTVRFPMHEFGWKALGAVLKQAGRTADALLPMQKAATLSPRDVEAHFNLGVTLQDLGRLGEAEASYRRAVEINPNYADAHGNLGVILKDQCRLHEAETSLRRALQIKPDNARTNSNLGVVLQNLGRLDEAETSFRLALRINPTSAEAHCNLGATLEALGRLEEAEASFRRALGTNPHFARAHSNLGIVLRGMGQLDEAAASCRKALEIEPDCVEAHVDLGITLIELGHPDQAEASFRRALEIRPDYAEAHCNLGVVLKALGQLDDAVASYRRALGIRPDFAEAHSNLGVVLQELGQLDGAVASYRRAIDIRPAYAEAHSNLGLVLQDLWQLDDAVASYRRALEIKPDYAEVRSNLLCCLSHDETVHAKELFAEHCRFGEQFESGQRAIWPLHSNSRDPERGLQVGFVSADLYNHSLAFFIEPVLAHLAAYPQLSLHAFYNHAIDDIVTQRLRKHLKHWHEIAGLADEVVAQKVRQAGIDILIDLSGHTVGNRLLTFARKPAPIQASWMGYPGTSGMQAMDYYLADRFFLPNECFGDQFAEALVHLPANAPFLPYHGAPAVNALPALSNGYVTFGSFNRASKISRSVVALWTRLLRAVPRSRLLLAAMPAADKEDTLIEWFAREGIERDRLSFHVRSDMDRYLALHQQVDVCLDTFPYNGGTTTLHALWMGVPTLTLAGNTPASRTGACILGHVGLEAFVAHDAEDFVHKGLFWASDLAALQDIRAGQREHFAKSAMAQPALIAEGLQSALQIMWQRWCKGLPPESFEVTGQTHAG